MTTKGQDHEIECASHMHRHPVKRRDVCSVIESLAWRWNVQCQNQSQYQGTGRRDWGMTEFDEHILESVLFSLHHPCYSLWFMRVQRQDMIEYDSNILCLNHWIGSLKFIESILLPRTSFMSSVMAQQFFLRPCKEVIFCSLYPSTLAWR